CRATRRCFHASPLSLPPRSLAAAGVEIRSCAAPVLDVLRAVLPHSPPPLVPRSRLAGPLRPGRGRQPTGGDAHLAAVPPHGAVCRRVGDWPPDRGDARRPATRPQDVLGLACAAGARAA